MGEGKLNAKESFSVQIMNIFFIIKREQILIVIDNMDMLSLHLCPSFEKVTKRQNSAYI